jgi:RNA polymerase sigma factor (TIGR02999 family)
VGVLSKLDGVARAVTSPGSAEDGRRNYNVGVTPRDLTDITGLLKAWRQGDQGALEELTRLVYPQLRAQARHYMRNERSGVTLQSTALVHEVYLRLINAADVDWHDRVHFFALSAQLMRNILIDAARARTAAKRGGGAVRAEHSSAVDLDEIPSVDSDPASSLCALDDALKSLTLIDPRRADVIELRFFGGLSVEETAEVLHVSPQTVMRDWRLARAWLARELRSESVSSHRARFVTTISQRP